MRVVIVFIAAGSSKLGPVQRGGGSDLLCGSEGKMRVGFSPALCKQNHQGD
jgi:hypothetical protein